VNKWLLTGIIIVIVLIIVGIAYDQGLFDNIHASTIAMLVAGLAAPYMALKNWITGDKFRQQFRDKYTQMESDETVHRTDYDQKIVEKEQRVSELDKQIQLLDAKLEVLELKKKNVEQTVNKMSVDDTKKEVQNLFGD
jgi:hypothetical protein